MTQRVGLLNGTNITYDKDLTAGFLAILNNGVIEGLGITGTGASANVLPGKALIECIRTNGEKVMVFFENTANVAVDLTGTKKLYILVNQAKLDDGSSNAQDGTGIGSIQTGASYPAGDYIPLASITGGVITDARETLTGKNIFRKGFSTGYILDIINGVEVEKQMVTSAVVNDTDIVRFKLADGTWKEVAYSVIKNAIAGAGKLTRSTTLGEAVPGPSTQNYTAQAFTTIQPKGLTYGGNMSNPDWAFNTNAGDSASAGNPGGVPRTCIISDIMFPVKITNFSFAGTCQYGISANSVIIYGTRLDGTVDTIYTHTPAISAGSYNINATISSTQYYVGFTIQQLDLGNGSTSINTVVTTGTYDVPALNVLAVVDRILYRNTLGSSAGANQTRVGIRINVPYACKIRNVKTWQTTSSSSASILILDASGATLQTTALTTGQQIADLNYTLTANTEYRIVLNDSANWTSGSTYGYTAIANFLATFPYILGSVYGASGGTLDNANGYIFTELELDFQGKAFRARADRLIETEFAMVSGFVVGPQSSGASVVLDNNENTYISGASFLRRSIYYVSQMAGYLYTSKGVIESIAGYATSLTNLIIGYTRPKRTQVISSGYNGAGVGLPMLWTGGDFDYTLTNSSTAITYLQWSFDKADWTNVDSWSAVSSTSGKGNLPRGYFRIYNPASTNGTYTIT